MDFQSRPEKVQAFRFTDQSERIGPQWFVKGLDDGSAVIDRVMNDGSIRTTGCTLYTKRARIRVKCGEYIIRWPDGTLTAESEKSFRQRFTRTREKSDEG